MNEFAKKIIKNKLLTLEKSRFRSGFHLNEKDLNYISKRGFKKIKEHAYDFIRKNIAGANPLNDGAQTPMKNHPVFIAQHATATCCRGCIEKWHHIKKGKELNENEINYIVCLIMEWIKNEYKKKVE